MFGSFRKMAIILNSVLMIIFILIAIIQLSQGNREGAMWSLVAVVCCGVFVWLWNRR